MFTSSRFRATAHLLQRDVDGRAEVAASTMRRNRAEAGHVRALADQHEAGVRADLERLQAAEPGCPSWRSLGFAARAHGPRQRSRGCAPASSRAPAGDVRGRPERTRERRRGAVGRFVVAAEGVRRAGVGWHEMRQSRPREVGHIRPHLLRAERADHPDDQRLGMLDRGPEGLDGLAARRTAGGSTTVTLIQGGNCGETSRAAAIAALRLSVSKIVSIRSRSTPPSASPRICSTFASTISSKMCVRNPVVDAPG